ENLVLCFGFRFTLKFLYIQPHPPSLPYLHYLRLSLSLSLSSSIKPKPPPYPLANSTPPQNSNHLLTSGNYTPDHRELAIKGY
ncbi:unnamed protein product, partial [Prunus brigantina]